MAKSEFKTYISEYISCQCGTEVLRIELDKDTWGKGKDEHSIYQFYLSLYTYGQDGRKPRLKDRFRQFWHYLRWGRPYADQMVLGRREAEQIRDYLDKALKKIENEPVTNDHIKYEKV